MTLSLYRASVPGFIRQLTQCVAWLDKARQHEAALPHTGHLLAARLAPDMFPLAIQIRIAVDGARGAALRLTGRNPSPPDAAEYAGFDRGDPSDFAGLDDSYASLTAYIQQAIEELNAVSPADMDTASGLVTVSRRGRSRVFERDTFLLHYALPNFHFHLSIAYALLRQAGVPLGKADFEGPPVYQVE